MNTSNSILLMLIWMLPNLLLSQPNYSIKLNPKEKDFIGRQFYIAEVIDKRPKKKFLGMVEKDGEMKALQFKDSFEEHLLRTFLKMYPCQSNLAPVMVAVHDLRVVESPVINNQQEGKVSIKLEFFYPDTSTTLYTLEHTKTYKAGDVTKKHKEAIEDLLGLSLLRANEYLQEKIANGEMSAPTFTPLKLPLPKGVYPDFVDMVKGKSDPIPFTAVRRLGKLERYDFKYLDRDRKKIKRAFCISDGKHLYLNTRVIASTRIKENPFYTLDDQPWKIGHYLKTQLTGRYICVEDRFAKGYLAYAFGIVGAVASSRTLGVVIDTNDGSFHILTRDYLKELLDNYPKQKAAYNATQKDREAKKDALQRFNDFLEEQSNSKL